MMARQRDPHERRLPSAAPFLMVTKRAPAHMVTSKACRQRDATSEGAHVDTEYLRALVVAATEREDLQHFNEMISSWPVQLAVVGLYVGLAVLAFSRVAREWDDGARRWVRAAAVALAVFALLMAVLREGVLDGAVWLGWLQNTLTLWVFAMWFYYAIRVVTCARPGEGDPDAQRRGAALEQILDEALDDARVASRASRPPT
jgi:hypothetical protein